MNKIRRNTVRERAWKVMRIKGQYTLTEITTLAEADSENIRHYHQCLVAAGYVKQIGTKTQEGRPGFDKVFRLVKNTGPKPPIQKDLRFLFDQNTGEYWSEDPERMAEACTTGDSPESTSRPCASVIPGQSLGITGKIDLKKPLKLLCPRRKREVPHVD